MPARRVVPARAAVLGVAMAAVLMSVPLPARAADAVPADQGGSLLGGTPITAIVGDIDGDGVRELVTLGPRSDDPVHLAVNVFEASAADRVASVGSAPLARVASVTEQLSGLPRPDEDGLLQARVDEPARLIAWRDRRGEHVLAVAIGTLRNARACCLSIWAVERSVDGGIRLRLLTDTMQSADQVWSVDMDGDGTDELLVTEPRQDANPNVLPISVLSWGGQRFDAQSAQVGVLGGGPLIPLGDSDGQPGDEMGLMRETQAGAMLHRISLTPGGEVRIAAGRLPFGGSLVPLEGPDGDRLVLGNDNLKSVALRWPAGGPIREVDRSGWIGVPAAAVGDAAEITLVTVRDLRLLDLFNAEFGAIRIGMDGAAAEDRFRRNDIAAYVGPLPGGTAGGGEAYIFRGRLVSDDSANRGGGPSVTDIGTMPGGAPIGLFGKGSGLLAIAQSTAISVGSGLDATREGGQLSRPAGGLRSTTVTVADATVALSPEADDGLLMPHPQGPVRVEPGATEPIVLAGGDFTLPIAAPPGTRLQLIVGGAVTSQEVPQEGLAELRVDLAEYEDGDGLRVALLAVTPAGQGYGGEWQVAIHTSPPSLSASTPFAPLSFDVSVSGRTAPDASVAVDGTPVPVARDGRFELAVDAGLWPRDVQVEAADPLGNRTSTTVSVVALVDYRQLPWIPIVAFLTILAGIVLFLRVPHARPEAASGPITDATLEDLD